jgi:hypothetical protein
MAFELTLPSGERIKVKGTYGKMGVRLNLCDIMPMTHLATKLHSWVQASRRVR